MKFHDAANLFPMEEETIGELAEDIRKNGQMIPIQLYHGDLLDGRRRWTACQQLGIEAKSIDVNPADPFGYVISLNLHRRQLTPSQKAMVAARYREYFDKAAKERQIAAQNNNAAKAVPANLPGQSGDARDLAGKALGVGGKSVDHATKVLTKGVPELVKAVEEGRMAVSSAAVLASEPEEVQKEESAKATRVYQGLKKKEPNPTVNCRKDPVYSPFTNAMQFSTLAISQLSRIRPEDPQRVAALLEVKEYIDNQLTKGECQ